MNEIPVHAVTEDRFAACMDAALTYLSYRPRGEAELRTRLTRRGFTRAAQDAVINKLAEQGLINDHAFAQFWKDSRDIFRPRSKWLIKRELKQKGVADEAIDEAVASLDDENNAYRAALLKVRHLSGLDYPGFRRKLGGYLQRRGFNATVIKHTLERIWKDQMRPADPASQAGPQ